MKKQPQHAKLMKGHPRRTTLRGKPVWEVDAGVMGGKRIRKRFENLPDAVEFQKSAKMQLIQMGDAFEALPVAKRAELLGTVAEMEKAGTNLLEVWNHWLRHNKGANYTLGQATDKWLKSLKEKKLRESYLIQSAGLVRHMLAKFTPDISINEIRTEDLDKWIRELTPGGALDRWRRTRTVFTYMHRKGWLLKNPSLALDAPAKYVRAPLVLKNDVVKNILSCCFGTYKHMAPYYILSLFTGIRGAEIQRLKWDAIDLENKQIKIEIPDSKTSRRRVVHMINNTAPVLSNFRDYPLWSDRHPGRVRKIRKLLQHPYKADCMRHTAATHLTNYYESFDKASMELGNSPNILRSTYYGIATPEETKEFFSIL